MSLALMWLLGHRLGHFEDSETYDKVLFLNILCLCVVASNCDCKKTLKNSFPFHPCIIPYTAARRCWAAGERGKMLYIISYDI